MLTPVQHWSGRRLDDRMRTLWGGWAIFAPESQVYYAGDTGYSQDFADTRARFAARQSAARGGGFDLALIPIGAYEPRWFMRDSHVNPDEALQVHLDLGAKRSLGVHWGTFPMTDEPLDQPPRDLAVARARAASPTTRSSCCRSARRKCSRDAELRDRPRPPGRPKGAAPPREAAGGRSGGSHGSAHITTPSST